MVRLLAMIVVLFAALPALAGGIATVDLQRAVNETTEGRNAQQTLDSMYSARQAEIERKGTELQKAAKDYEARRMVLSEDARKSEEAKLMRQQQELMGLQQQYEAEMQKQYWGLLEGLVEKLRVLAEKIGKEKGYDLVLDSGVVVYSGGSTADITDDLIRRYNAQ
jgi:outer membrane protein